MGSRDDKRLPAFGFLTVVQHEQHGLFGGYLLLNANGRPLEFHCTAPVKPNRAQEILYGPTLEPYLYGEQIGQTLIAKGQNQPVLVCTDLAPVLAVRQFVEAPVMLVLSETEEDAGAESIEKPTFRIDVAHRGGPSLAIFRVGRNRLAVPAGYARDQEQAAAELETVAEHIDLSEPFARIRGAIEEAQRGGR
ncbi:MAG TPA: hypothetical protein VHC19_22535 [Pirellulales bacterium]|nr:hypothetical protein [Pirellulales bacterium]